MPDNRPWEEPWRDADSVAEIGRVWAKSADEARWRDWIAGLVAPTLRPGEQVLEVGCGGGLVYGALSKGLGERLRYTGVDNSEPMLQMARGAYPKANFTNADAFALGFPDGKFGTVLCISVLGHLPDYRPVLNELFRVASHQVVASFWLPAVGRQGEDGDLFAKPNYYLHTQAGIERAVAKLPGGPWSVHWHEMGGYSHALMICHRDVPPKPKRQPSTVRVLTLSNKPDLLPEAVASVKAQTRQDGLRHIIALDDGTRDWQGRYPPNVFWNEQAALADPDDYLIMLSDDDLFLPNAIEDLAGYLDANPDEMACYGAGDMYVHSPPAPDVFLSHIPSKQDYHGRETLQGRVGSGMVMWRACAWRELGPFPETAGDMSLSDGEWFTRLAARFGLHAIGKKVIRTRMTNQSAHTVPNGQGGYRTADWRRLQPQPKTEPRYSSRVARAKARGGVA